MEITPDYFDILRKYLFLDLNLRDSSKQFHTIDPQCLQWIKTIPHYWTSMSIIYQNYCMLLDLNASIHQNYSIFLDLNASNPSDTKPAIQQASQQTSQRASHPTSKPVNESVSQPSNEQFLAGGQGAPGARGRPRGDGRGGDGFPELWPSDEALFQRAQEPNMPCGESLTSIFATTPPRTLPRGHMGHMESKT